MKRSRKMMIALGLGLVPSLALADVDSTLIQPVEAFKTIFGIDATSLTSMLAGDEPTVLATISVVINTACLTAAIAVILVTFFTGLMQQAHEGEVLGRRYSSLWVPLRSLLAIFYLIPLPTGYSILQILVLWVTFLGSTAADKAWEMSVDKIATNIIVGQGPTIPSALGLAQSLYESTLCQARINLLDMQTQQGSGLQVVARPIEAQLVTPPPEFDWGLVNTQQGPAISLEKVSPPSTATAGLSFDGLGRDGSVIKGVCGSYLNERKSTEEGSIARWNTLLIQQANLQYLADQVRPIAVEAQHGDANIAELRKMLVRASAQYEQRERQRALQFVAESSDEVFAAQARQLDYSREVGWVSAGAWYLTIAGLNDAISQQMVSGIKAAGPRVDQLPTSMRQDVAPYIERANILQGSGFAQTSSTDSGGLATALENYGGEIVVPPRHDRSWIPSWVPKSWISDGIQEPLKTTAGNMMDNMTEGLRDLPLKVMSFLSGVRRPGSEGADSEPGGDAVIRLQSAGATILEGASAAFGVGLLSTGFVGLLAPGPALMLWGIMKAILVPVLLVGFAFRYYIPLVPYLYWAIGILTWLMIIVEMVLIAPVIAASVALPDGEGWAGQQARPFFLSLFAAVTRPILMLVGLFAGMLILHYMVLWISVTFMFVMGMTQGGAEPSAVGAIAYLVIAGGLIVAAVRLSFGLIHFIPDRALRRFDGGDNLGDMGGERHVHGGAMIAYGAASGAIGAVQPPMRGRTGPTNAPAGGGNQVRRR